MPKNTNLYFWLSIGLGWIFDLLFWGKSFGISFPIFVWLTVGVGIYIAGREKIEPARPALWLLLPILFFSSISVIRVEPLTTFLNRSFTLFFMALFASSFTGGKWIVYQLIDYASNFGKLLFSVVARAMMLFLSPLDGQDDDVDAEQAKQPASIKKIYPILRGLILALPVALIFGGLLSSADPIFSDLFERFLDLFRIEFLPEYIARFILIFSITLFLIGTYVHAFFHSGNKNLPRENALITKFLGLTEALVVMGSVVSMFSVFVVIQVQYLFGGQENIQANGYTYAEYARRGFYELMVVAFFSLLLFFVMSSVTKRSAEIQQRLFSGVSLALVILVAIMLASAFRRLALYEFAFGFTRLRLYSHMFMIWIGILLLAIATLEIIGRQRNFVLFSLIAMVGFVANLSLINIDGFIARENITRLNQFTNTENDLSSSERQRVSLNVDMGYIASLSNDAVPAMAAVLLNARRDNDAVIVEIAVAALACHAYRHDDYQYSLPWQSFVFPNLFTAKAWDTLAGELLDIPQLIEFDEFSRAYVEIDGTVYHC